MRFITCGSVDDGKSTLIGRLLWEAQQIFDDQLAALVNESQKYGTQGEKIDFALLVDGLSAEREQGITIDVAYRFFATPTRRFIVADTPGHEQYTRNMVTGASTAQAAVLLVNAQQGVLVQTRRHTYLAALMGIRQVVLAVNKMDLVGFSEPHYRQILEQFTQFAQTLDFENITAVPLSALEGDNVTRPSARMPWYTGPTLLGRLETIPLEETQPGGLIFPVQWVNRPDADFRGYSGTVARGKVHPGELLRVTASGQTAQVTEIVTMDGLLPLATQGQAVTLRLDREVDISRGDVLTRASEPLEVSDQFSATLVWLSEEDGLAGRSYDLKLATQWSQATLTSLGYRIDVNTLAQQPAPSLGLNDLAQVHIATLKPLALAPYSQSKAMGSFLLVDRFTQATVAAGMVQHSLRRSQNVYRQALSIDRIQREKLSGHPGRVVWFTGLSGSGKSTLANALEVALCQRGWRTYLLDGDNLRQGLNQDLGFSDADRVENVRRVTEVARLMFDAGLVVLVALISPFRRERELARQRVGEGHFLEVFVDTPLEVCEARDPKGLYRKARSGQLPNLSGVGSVYERPENPDLVLANLEVDQAVELLLQRLMSI